MEKIAVKSMFTPEFDAPELILLCSFQAFWSQFLSQFIPKVLDEVEVRGLCRPVRRGTISLWNCTFPGAI